MATTLTFKVTGGRGFLEATFRMLATMVGTESNQGRKATVSVVKEEEVELDQSDIRNALSFSKKTGIPRSGSKADGGLKLPKI